MTLKKNCYLLFFLLFLTSFPVFAAPSERYIVVDKIEAKSRPSIWSRASGSLFYGDKVSFLEEDGVWGKVSKKETGVTGWVKLSCLTSRKINAKKKVSVDADEISLAGKGFSNALEAEYSNQYDIDFDVVDDMENIKLSSTELYNFIVDGKLEGKDL